MASSSDFVSSGREDDEEEETRLSEEMDKVWMLRSASMEEGGGKLKLGATAPAGPL